MIEIDLDMPKCCDDCKLVYDSCKCMITGSRIDWEKSEIERLSDCPLKESQTGHWIGIDEEPHEDYECDVCGHVVSTWTANIKPQEEYKFCPNCGADMRGDTDADSD